MLILTVALLGVSLVNGPYPDLQFLQHAPTVAALGLLAYVAAKNRLSNGSFFCCTAFLWLHILGARYIYSYVPYNAWSAAVCGSSLAELGGFERNHYDRFVHLAFGILAVPPMYEISRRAGGLTPRWAAAFALCAVSTISGLYEIFEWLLTIFAAPDQADAYNGQQGDQWDAQKDMALALAGALAATAMVVWRTRRTGIQTTK